MQVRCISFYSYCRVPASSHQDPQFKDLYMKWKPRKNKEETIIYVNNNTDVSIYFFNGSRMRPELK